MKITGRSVVFAIAGAAVAAVGLAAPATADAPATATASGATVAAHHRGDGVKPPAELGNPSAWGSVTFKMDDSADSVSSLASACLSPSTGGTWCYGWYTVEVSPGVFHKYCYSNYAQDTKYHSSTVQIAGYTRKVYANAGYVSNANLTEGLAYTCSTYYAVY
ncbi:lactococcin 972 family bacteriocin [Streptomyces vietnamensis]|uniref:lactococcin 972 family bacteriocin n=1 Tax=Streptomyces vietnamensis TaxID=362257 RepID=UPI00378CD072